MSPRDFLQLIQRVRHPVHKDVIMYVKYRYSDANVCKRDLALDGLRMVDFHGIGRLAENLSIERRARYSKDLLKALQLFTEYTTFEQESNKRVMCAAERDLFWSCISTKEHLFAWDSIKMIDDITSTEIEQQLKRFDADMDDYLQVMKYYFIKLFVPDVDEDVMAEQWDKNRDATIAMNKFGKLRKYGSTYASDATIIINDLLKENDIDLYEDDYEIKSRSVPFSEIKKAFDFRRQPTTLRNDLYAKIFNAYFQENV